MPSAASRRLPPRQPSLRRRVVHSVAARFTLTALSLLPVVAAQTTDPCATLAAANNYVNGVTTNATVPTAEEVFACYNSFSIDSATKTSHIALVKQYFQLYPYLDLVKSSSSPYFSSSLDLLAALDSIASNSSIVSEYDFHSQIYQVVASLNDAHSYYASNCFSLARLVQPFVISSKSNSGAAPTIYIRGPFTTLSAVLSSGSTIANGIATALGNLWTSSLNGQASQYTNYTISKINGVDAVSYIQSLADAWSGVSHSAETRFNSFMPYTTWSSTKSKFVLTDGQIYRIRWFPSWLPRSITYDLVSPSGQTVTLSNVPWGAYFSGTKVFSDRDSFYQNNCVPDGVTRSTPASTSASTEFSASTDASSSLTDAGSVTPVLSTRSLRMNNEADLADFGKIDRNLRRPLRTTLSSSFTFNETEALAAHNLNFAAASSKISALRGDDLASAASSFSITNPLVSSVDTAFYMLDSTTGVWVFSTVDPTDESDTGISNFVGTITSGLKALESAGASKLVIDTTANGGGIICVGTALLQYLFSSATALPYDLRLSTGMSALLKYTNPTAAASAQNSDSLFSTYGLIGKTSKSSDITSNPSTITRGGVSSSYSDKFDLDCSSFISAVSSVMPALSKGWSPNAVFLVSDGQCGSTCAEFTRVLRDEFKVTAYSFSGSSGAAFQPSSFEGGSVGSFDTILSDVQSLVKSSTALAADTTALSALPTTAFSLDVTASLPVWESYSLSGSGGSQVPVEWVPEAADAHLVVADPIDRAAVWTAAAAAAGNPTNTGRGSATTQATTTAKSAAQRAWSCSPSAAASLGAVTSALFAMVVSVLLW